MLISNKMFFLPLRSKSAVHISEQSNGYCNEKSQYLSPMTNVDCEEVRIFDSYGLLPPKSELFVQPAKHVRLMRSNSDPSGDMTTPPASDTITAPAAMSQQ